MPLLAVLFWRYSHLVRLCGWQQLSDGFFLQEDICSCARFDFLTTFGQGRQTPKWWNTYLHEKLLISCDIAIQGRVEASEML